MMGPMVTKLFSLPSSFIVMSGMRMFGPDGGVYNPSSGEYPRLQWRDRKDSDGEPER